jgi:hypothetical protein
VILEERSEEYSISENQPAAIATIPQSQSLSPLGEGNVRRGKLDRAGRSRLQEGPGRLLPDLREGTLLLSPPWRRPGHVSHFGHGQTETDTSARRASSHRWKFPLRPSRATAVVLLCRNRQTEFVRFCARNQMACRRERSLASSAHQVKTSIPVSANLRLMASFTRFLGAPDPMSTDAPFTAFSKTTVVEAAQPLQAGRTRGKLASAAALEAPETLLFAVAQGSCLLGADTGARRGPTALYAAAFG